MASACRVPAASCSSSASLRGNALRGARAAPVSSSRRAMVVAADSRKAVVVLTGTAGVAGTVTFTQQDNGARAARGGRRGRPAPNPNTSRAWRRARWANQAPPA
jgi:hypothetical protein